MPVYFASDMHLRHDRPDRARRLARWVDTLKADDALYLVGDVCDFWLASRERPIDVATSEGLRALANFRERGGALTVLVGNHDLWLGPDYEQILGATLAAEPLIVEAHGQRVWLAHGHRAGGREPWKACMESHAFFTAFAHFPDFLASRLDHRLESRNEAGRARDEARLVTIYQHRIARIDPTVDLAIFGHVHTPFDDPNSRPRLIVIGGWHDRTCYVRLDEAGTTHVVEPAQLGKFPRFKSKG